MKRIIGIFVGIVVVVIICIVVVQKTPTNDNTVVLPPAAPTVDTAITITSLPIKEQYYSGTSIGIAGTSTLADTARLYVTSIINDFAATAAKEVPPMATQFGAGSPPATYTIDLNAVVVTGQTTTSIVIDSYVYRGGANGMSAYKVFTASKTTGKILALTDIIPTDKQQAFVSFVKKELLAQKDYGVFPQDVQTLTMNSFRNWSFDTEGNLTIYFDKYEIGPGALGAVAFPISSDKVQPYL